MRALLAGTLLITLTGPTLTSEAAPTATTWYVSTSGNDNNTCQTAGTACRNIKRAIDKAASGDTIVIGSGTFFENLDIAKSLVLQGAGVGSTIIDGSDLDTTVVIAGAGEAINVTLTSLTVQNGKSGGGLGGGFLISGGTVTLSNLAITSNIATIGGGGI
jgi:hypothetical protein